MFKRLIFILLVISANISLGYGQSLPDPHFSQFYANPLYLNPALAGSNICPRIIFNYRNQWPALSQTFVTYNASFDMYVNKIHGGVGIDFLADRAGDGMLNTTAVKLMYAYKFRVSENVQLAAAIEGSYMQTRLDWDKLQFGEQIDPNYGYNPSLGTPEVPPENTSLSFVDFSAGAAFAYKSSIYGGVAVHHLTEPDNSFYNDGQSKLYMKFTVHGGALIDLSGSDSYDLSYGSFSISPNFLYQQQYNFHQLNVGLYLTKLPVIAGAWFRHNFELADAIIPMVGVEFKGFRFSYSYDISLSKLAGVAGGAHEISASYQFECLAEKRRRIRAINCPRF